MNPLTVQELIDILLTIKDKSGTIKVSLGCEDREVYVTRNFSDNGIVLAPFYEDRPVD